LITDVVVDDTAARPMTVTRSIARSGGVNHMKINIVNNLCMQNDA